jgi:flavin reductase (DIM6/NTAB) family NADH-FMN oxidoreductase RutF
MVPTTAPTPGWHDRDVRPHHAARVDFETVDAGLFRHLLRRHAATVVVVTVPGGQPAGLTATSFTSVSMKPPLVSFAVSRTASTWAAVIAADTAAVHVLTNTQEDAARTFAAHDVDRFAEYTAWRPGGGGLPLLDGVLARIVCRIVRRIPAGDHTIILAAPVSGEVHVDETTRPLVYHAGRYTTLDPSR